jgi:thymidylate synthase (FAD)
MQSKVVMVLVKITLDDVQFAYDTALRTYKEMLDQGVAPEMARMILPQNTYTEWYWSGSLYAFSRVVKLRLDKASQLEVQEIAQNISDNCTKLFPNSWKALINENKQ